MPNTPLRAVPPSRDADVVASFRTGPEPVPWTAHQDRQGLSIAVCTYRRAASLSAFLDSVRLQTQVEALHIVDASQDASTEEMLLARNDLGALATNVDYVRVGRQMAGLTRQRNIALDRVRTDLVAFFDDDVVLGEGCVDAMTSKLREHPALVGVGAVATNERGGPTNLWRMRRALGIVDTLRPGRYCRSGMSVSWSLLRADEPITVVDWLPGYAMMWRTAVARHVTFNPEYGGYANGEDIEFGLRARRRGPLAIASGATLLHQQAPAGRPGAFTLGFTTVRNAYDIHRRCLPDRSLPDIAWFGYAFTADTLLQSLALVKPPGPAWRVPYAMGRVAALAGAALGWGMRRADG